MNALAGMPGTELTSEIVARIAEIGKLRFPNEACGVLTPTPQSLQDNRASQVIEIPNRSLHPADQYIMEPADIHLELDPWYRNNSHIDPHRIAFWHTHPQGNIGPSRGDLMARLEEFPYLVVALTESGPIPTWF